MTFDERLKNVSVIGAAGKMGSGIALLLAQEMARLKYLPEKFRITITVILQFERSAKNKPKAEIETEPEAGADS